MTRVNCVLWVALAIAALAISACDTVDQIGQVAEVMNQAPQNQAAAEQQAQAQAEAMAAAMTAQMQAEMQGQPGAQPGAVPAPAQPASAGPTGVPDCDTYLDKYPKCLEAKVPAMAKAQMMQGFQQTAAAWKQAAATPEGKAALAPQCKMALDMAKAAMKVYGCEL